MDIKINYSEYGDFSIEECDIALDPGIKTAVIISLFTDARIPESVHFTGDRRGYWGDVVEKEDYVSTGSLIWTLKRERISRKTIDLLKQYCKDALNWMITDNVADEIIINIDKSVQNVNMLLVKIFIFKNKKNLLRYNFNWQSEII